MATSVHHLIKIKVSLEGWWQLPLKYSRLHSCKPLEHDIIRRELLDPLGITDPTDHEIMCCKLHSQSSLASSPPLSTNPAPSSIFPKGELVQCDLRRLAARINAVWVGSTATYNHLWLVPTLRGACSCPAALPLLVSSHGLWMNPPQIISPSLLHWNSF